MLSLGVQALDLEAAEATGIFRIRGIRLEFRTRSSARWRTRMPRRLAAQRAPRARRRTRGNLANDRSVWHRALASVEPDDTVAAASRTSGSERWMRVRVQRRAFEEAARMSTDSPERSRRLFGAARAAEASGHWPPPRPSPSRQERWLPTSSTLLRSPSHRARARAPRSRHRRRHAGRRRERAAAVDPERARGDARGSRRVAVYTDFARADRSPVPRGSSHGRAAKDRAARHAPYADTLAYRGMQVDGALAPRR